MGERMNENEKGKMTKENEKDRNRAKEQKRSDISKIKGEKERDTQRGTLVDTNRDKEIYI